MRGKRLEADSDLRDLLTRARTIAILGLSPKPDRDSYRIAHFLQREGYRVVPVNPRGEAVLGEPGYATLADALGATSPDLVDVFRRPDALPQIVEEAVGAGAPLLWFQLGISNPEAEERALDAGLDLVVDRCIAVEHRRLMPRS